MSVKAIIVAAGSGERFGADKILANLSGKSVIEHSLSFFQNFDPVDEIVVVTSSVNKDTIDAMISRYSKVSSLVLGGETRSESVRNGFEALSYRDGDIVLIHNGANPLLTEEEVSQLLSCMEDCRVASVAHEVVDTVKEVDEGNVVLQTHDRSTLRLTQTPQAFHTSTLAKLYEQFGTMNVTDELQLAERAGEKIVMTRASRNNFKITTQEDLARAESLLGVSQERIVGLGEDSHRFSDEGELVMGGVVIPGCPKLLGNSDGDVILHTIFNAISSAVGRGSIGGFADPLCEKGVIDSSEYVRLLMLELAPLGYRVCRVSISLECKRPKVDPHVGAMKDVIGSLLGIDHDAIGITATSGEGLTSFGRGEGIRCTCIATVIRS